MTDEEMRNRIIEIDKLRNLLKEEQYMYIQALRKNSDIIEFEERQKYINKYFIADGFQLSYTNVKAIKILSIEELPHHSNAKCLIITFDGIKKDTILLWSIDSNTKLPIGNIMIFNHFKEITEEEFNSIFNQQLENLKT